MRGVWEKRVSWWVTSEFLAKVMGRETGWAAALPPAQLLFSKAESRRRHWSEAVALVFFQTLLTIIVTSIPFLVVFNKRTFSFIWKRVRWREKVRQRKRNLPSAGFTPKWLAIAWSWVRLRSGARNSIRVFHVDGRCRKKEKKSRSECQNGL